MCLYVDAEEHELGDLVEPVNYKAALFDPESDKWLNAMNVKMQSMKDNKVWDLVDLLPDGKTIDSKWLFKRRLTWMIFLENSKRGTILMQEKLKLSKSQGASTPTEKSICKISHMPRLLDQLCELHWTTVKNILKYLRNTKDMFLFYEGDTKRELRVSCYTDAGYLTDADDLKSQTGYVFILNGGVVDWKSTKQSIFATSSTNVDYIAAFDASKEAVWIQKFIYRLGVVPTIKKPINMYCDNTEAITIAKDHGITKGARRFRVKVYYLRETIEMGDVRIKKLIHMTI
nr:hypothetical protein [Tanacetum cinerariifolium]